MWWKFERRKPTNKEIAIRALVWRQRFRKLESFIVSIRYGWWGWKRWLKSIKPYREPERKYEFNALASLHCSKCGVLQYWGGRSMPRGDFACPLCGNIQNLYKIKAAPDAARSNDAG